MTYPSVDKSGLPTSLGLLLGIFSLIAVAATGVWIILYWLDPMPDVLVTTMRAYIHSSLFVGGFMSLTPRHAVLTLALVIGGIGYLGILRRIPLHAVILLGGAGAICGLALIGISIPMPKGRWPFDPWVVLALLVSYGVAGATWAGVWTFVAFDILSSAEAMPSASKVAPLALAEAFSRLTPAKRRNAILCSIAIALAAPSFVMGSFFQDHAPFCISLQVDEQMNKFIGK